MALTECEFLVFSQVVHVDVAIGLHPVFVGFGGERADEACPKPAAAS